MNKNIKIGSDAILILRIKELIDGEVVELSYDSDNLDFPLYGIRVYLMYNNKEVFAQYGVDVHSDNTTHEVTDFLPINTDSLSSGIISLNLKRDLTAVLDEGSYFGVVDILMVQNQFENGYFVYTIPDRPVYLGEIIANEL